MLKKYNDKFLDLLVEERVLTEDDKGNLVKKFDNNASEIFEFLIEGGAASRELMAKLWGDSLDKAYIELGRTMMQEELLDYLPSDFARKNYLLPLYKFGDVITVATSDPENQMAMQKLEEIYGCKISTVFALPEDLEDTLEITFQDTSKVDEFVNKITVDSLFKGTSKITAGQLQRMAGDQAIIELVRAVMLIGIKEGASDIHIEPQEKFTQIRYRIDGVLQTLLKLDLAVLPGILSRLKVMSNLDITERRLPLDGRAVLKLKNRSIDFRISTTPSIYGEKAVLRILGQKDSRSVPSLTDLNFSKFIYERLSKIMENPNGVFFVTGPTGSGKTTTLYSLLKYLNSPNVNIMTIEDPVEYRLPGLTQVQVNQDVGLGFTNALRSFLRQDPDIILIGEIRDIETARISAQAALTGHLVLATMHTNDSMQAITRLLEIGVQPFLVAPSMIGVMSQRLVRQICDHCKEPYELTPEEINEHFNDWDGVTTVTFYRGAGCPRCHGSGYRGRLAIHELLIINTELRKVIGEGASILEIKDFTKKMNFRNLRYDGFKKILRGLTTLEELNRVTIAEDALE
ncbi:GspE/PulE family protein [Limisalsivibrio acetivorans]|uniref:GspE/PulE family protein n=1 Tax=Limisalsivibrio acetivorans TaxID=1304888 RepID=UPI0003B3F371|nr:GspE/PulE family protein [Limisalsivibrio acetivorans]